jgi:hypothetical protein
MRLTAPAGFNPDRGFIDEPYGTKPGSRQARRSLRLGSDHADEPTLAATFS